VITGRCSTVMVTRTETEDAKAFRMDSKNGKLRRVAGALVYYNILAFQDPARRAVDLSVLLPHDQVNQTGAEAVELLPESPRVSRSRNVAKVTGMTFFSHRCPTIIEAPLSFGKFTVQTPSHLAARPCQGTAVAVIR